MEIKILKDHRNIFSIYFAAFTFLAAGYEFCLSYKHAPYQGEALIYSSTTGQNLCHIPVMIEEEKRYEKGIISNRKKEITIDCDSNQSCILNSKINQEKLQACLRQQSLGTYLYQVRNKSKEEASFHFLLGAGFFFSCLGFVSYYHFKDLESQSTVLLDDGDMKKTY